MKKLTSFVALLFCGLMMAGCVTVDAKLEGEKAHTSAKSNTIRSKAGSIHALVTQVAERKGVPVSIAHAVVRKESNYNPVLRGRAGEWGLTQIKCPTARGLGFSGDCSRLADPETNLVWGLEHLRRAIARGGPGCVGVALHQAGLYARLRCTSYGASVMQFASLY